MSDESPDIERALIELGKLYDRVAEATAHLSCIACGRCCHFDEVDHILYCSDLEALYLQNISGSRSIERQGRCPYQDESACHARDGRPLGCRIHFCNLSPDDKAALEAIAETAHRELKEIHNNCGIPWKYAPLLTRLT